MDNVIVNRAMRKAFSTSVPACLMVPRSASSTRRETVIPCVCVDVCDVAQRQAARDKRRITVAVSVVRVQRPTRPSTPTPRYATTAHTCGPDATDAGTGREHMQSQDTAFRDLIRTTSPAANGLRVVPAPICIIDPGPTMRTFSISDVP